MFTIVHKDDEVVVVNKEAGLLTVPAYDAPCLVDLLQRELDRVSFARYRLGVVHRLDRETSGLLVFARTRGAAARLSKDLAAHRFDRQYVAVVKGLLAEDSGTIDAKLWDKHARTHFEVIERTDNVTMVAVRLETGRRRQIRLHFAGIGHPVVGDEPHERWPLTRIALHARVLGFVHPKTKVALRFEAEVPQCFAAVLGRSASYGG